MIDKEKPKLLPLGIGGIILLILVFGENSLPQFWSTSKYSTPAPVHMPTNIPPTNPIIGSRWNQSIDDMTMIYVPAGEFEMGTQADEAMEECQNSYQDCERDWFTREDPPHHVYVDAFWIDETEVNNAMYAQCVALGDCGSPYKTNSYTRDSYFGNKEFDDYPVIYISWVDASAYCKWGGRRLPTEAEWEKAAGWDGNKQMKNIYPWGDSFDGTNVNFCDETCTNSWKNGNYYDGFQDTAPVGSYPAGVSFYGALDMAGNAWEWVADWYAGDYYSNSPSSNPVGPKKAFSRVLRGGSWNDNATFVRTANRMWFDPESANFSIGFRCARDASP